MKIYTRSLKVGTWITTDIGMGHTLTGYVGEIDEDYAYIWQNKIDGGRGKIDPIIATHGKLKYSYSLLINHKVSIVGPQINLNEPDINPFTLIDNFKPLTHFKFKHTLMNNIVNFARNLTLSSDEKKLRKAGLKDECGQYTREARQIVMLKLCKDNEKHLLEIATMKKEEEKEDKK